MGWSRYARTLWPSSTQPNRWGCVSLGLSFGRAAGPSNECGGREEEIHRWDAVQAFLDGAASKIRNVPLQIWHHHRFWQVASSGALNCPWIQKGVRNSRSATVKRLRNMQKWLYQHKVFFHLFKIQQTSFPVKFPLFGCILVGESSACAAAVVCVPQLWLTSQEWYMWL